MKSKINLIVNSIMLSITALLLIVSYYAWYTANREVTADGITGVTANNEVVHFDEPVIAKKHCLSGDLITTYYNIRPIDGVLLLTKMEYYSAETGETETTTEFQTQQFFDIKEILPGEYVDITIGYSMETSMNNNSYNVRLNGLIGELFNIDGFDHSVAGAFKYKSLSLKDEAHKDTDTNVSDFTPDTNPIWFCSYDIASADTVASYINILNHTWKDSYDTLYYTFRIEEDFSQYYQLIREAQNSYGNVLSNKNFSISNVYFFV